MINQENKPQELLDVFRRATANPNGRGTVPTIVGELRFFLAPPSTRALVTPLENPLLLPGGCMG